MTRRFAAQFLVPLGPGFVAVDRVQPVAATIMQDGSVRSVVSWAGQVAPPSEAAWPNRRLGVGNGCVVVQDLPDGEPVTVRVAPDGVLEARAGLDVPWDGLVARHPRIFRQAGGHYGDWRLASQLYYGNRWASQVRRQRDGVVSVWRAGRGTFVAHAMADDVLAVSVRLGDKRPWSFRPAHDLYLLRGHGPGIAPPVAVDPIDIADRCWPERPPDLVRGLQSYLPFSVGQADAVRRLGATDVRLEVDGIDRWPVIELSFALPQAPGVRFVQRDEPFDELGHLSGLRFLNVCFAGASVESLIAGAVAVNGRVEL